MRNTLLFFLCILFSSPLLAKDLTNRLGIGYSDQLNIPQGLPSATAYYFPNPDVGMALSLGVNTEEDDSRFGLMFKVFKIIFPEDNLNFYMGASAGIISYEEFADDGVTIENESGFELNALLGVQFSFAGLENLAFHFETGLGITSVDDGVSFRTIGDTPFEAGVIFFF